MLRSPMYPLLGVNVTLSAFSLWAPAGIVTVPPLAMLTLAFDGMPLTMRLNVNAWTAFPVGSCALTVIGYVPGARLKAVKSVRIGVAGEPNRSMMPAPPPKYGQLYPPESLQRRGLRKP